MSAKMVNINKFAGLSRDWVGAKVLFMCFFLGSFLMGSHWRRKTHKKVPPPPQKNPGTIPWKFYLCVFSFHLFFFAPKSVLAEFRPTFDHDKELKSPILPHLLYCIALGPLGLHSSVYFQGIISRSCRVALVRIGYGFGVERFKRFRFSVLALCISCRASVPKPQKH